MISPGVIGYKKGYHDLQSMSKLRTKIFRSDRKYPTFIRLRILVFPISVIFTDVWPSQGIIVHQSASIKILTFGEKGVMSQFFARYFGKKNQISTLSLFLSSNRVSKMDDRLFQNGMRRNRKETILKLNGS